MKWFCWIKEFCKIKNTQQKNLWSSLQSSKHHKALENIINLAKTTDVYEFFFKILNDEENQINIASRFSSQGLEIINSFLFICLDFNQKNSINLQNFLEFVEKIDPEISLNSTTPNQIKITTIHSSKGLQAPIVIMPDCLYAFSNQLDNKEKILWLNDFPLWINKDSKMNSIIKKISEDKISENYEEIPISSMEELFLIINKYLNPDQDTTLNITDVYYTDKYVVQCIYMLCNDKSNPKFNVLASQITKNTNVLNTMIFIKRDITNEKQPYINFDINDLIEIIKDTFVHNALIVKPSNEIINFPYINDVLESRLEEHTIKNIRYYEYKYLDYIYTFFCDISTEQIPENLNEKASVIYGNKIYGEVFITLTSTREDFNTNLNMTEDLFNKLYILHATKSSDLNLQKYARKPKETTTSLYEYGFPYITYDPNIFSVINNEYNLNKNKEIVITANDFTDILNNI